MSCFISCFASAKSTGSFFQWVPLPDFLLVVQPPRLFSSKGKSGTQQSQMGATTFLVVIDAVVVVVVVVVIVIVIDVDARLIVVGRFQNRNRIGFLFVKDTKYLYC